jgi:hypothetical protein
MSRHKIKNQVKLFLEKNVCSYLAMNQHIYLSITSKCISESNALLCDEEMLNNVALVTYSYRVSVAHHSKQESADI